MHTQFVCPRRSINVANLLIMNYKFKVKLTTGAHRTCSWGRKFPRNGAVPWHRPANGMGRKGGSFCRG